MLENDKIFTRVKRKVFLDIAKRWVGLKCVEDKVFQQQWPGLRSKQFAQTVSLQQIKEWRVGYGRGPLVEFVIQFLQVLLCFSWFNAIFFNDQARSVVQITHSAHALHKLVTVCSICNI